MMPTDPYRVTSIRPIGGADGMPTPPALPDDGQRRLRNQTSPEHPAPTGPRDPLNTPAVTYVQFRLDRTTGQVVMHVLDNETGEIVRQVPSEEMLRLAAELQKYLDHSQRRTPGYGGE